ncbi:5-(carboxyamino)imidazole ribonucleotide synthase [Pararhodospirillum photometricum]|nr:5-(carboxyamino)imidazole ribonucleotide synthase [Pararhodospirillum photometricum]
MIGPGGWIGILGGGQLGRMTALAAARLGLRCHIYTPEAEGPAGQVASRVTVAPYEDLDALARWADSVDVITFEFENVPAASLASLAGRRPLRPGPRALEIAQDRISEKSFFADLGIPTAPWVPVHGADDLRHGLAHLGGPALLKTARLGYDGKGQLRLDPTSDPEDAWRSLGQVPAVLEGLVSFSREVSVIVARGLDGAVACFDPTENVHRNGILHTSTVPAALSEDEAEAACRVAIRAAQALDLVGLLAVEMFLTMDGQIIANEMAPRPHNSGHWTMDACHTDQFEQLVRAVCGLPLGDPGRFRPLRMLNLIGDDVLDWVSHLARPGARLHLYGKHESRPGRKMGHVNFPPTP